MTALAPKSEQRLTVRSWLEKALPEIRKAAPKHVDPQRLVRVVLTACIQTPKLLHCTQESLMRSVLQCAQLGLEPDGLLGQAYLLPFDNKRKGVTECQLLVGYQGKLRLARQSGEVSAVIADVVHKADEFEYHRGLEKDHFKHVPTDKEEAGPVTHAYCIVRLKDGTASLTVLTVGQIEREHRARSMADQRGDSPWKTDYEAMCKKTALHVGLKYAPKSVELARALEIEERVDKGIPVEVDLPDDPIIDVPAIPEKGSLDALTDKLSEGETTPPAPTVPAAAQPPAPQPKPAPAAAPAQAPPPHPADAADAEVEPLAEEPITPESDNNPFARGAKKAAARQGSLPR